MEVERLKKEWRRQWEAERSKVSPAEVRASIDRKIEAIRVRLETERAALWAQLSEETRAAWERFAELRARDVAAMADKAGAQSLLGMTPERNTPTVQPPGLRRQPEAKPPRTQWTLKDEDFGKP